MTMYAIFQFFTSYAYTAQYIFVCEEKYVTFSTKILYLLTANNHIILEVFRTIKCELTTTYKLT